MLSLWFSLLCIAIIFFGRKTSSCTRKSFPCENISIIKWKLPENNGMVSELKVWLKFWVSFYLTGLLLWQHLSKIQNNDFWYSLQLWGHACQKEHSLVSVPTSSSSNLTCRESFLFIPNTCISSKPSAVQFSNVPPIHCLRVDTK